MSDSIYRQTSDTAFNLLSHEHLINPFPTYKKMREHSPVCQVEPGGYWAISRLKDVQLALKCPEIFSSTAYSQMYEADWLKDECKSTRFILSQDPPVHGPNRALVNEAFAQPVIEELTELISTTAAARVAAIPRGKEIDLMEFFSYPYVGTVIRHILGINDKQSLPELRQWIELEEKITPGQPSDEFIRNFEAAINRQNEYFNATIQDRRRSPRKDLVSILINAKVGGVKLSDDMLRSAMGLLVSAGFETTIQMLNHAVIRLSRQRELVVQLKSQPDLIPAFIEELLRHTPSVHSILRKTIAPKKLSGVVIPKNALVMVMLASANRDDSRFSNPDNFDLYRPKIQQHFSFGRGIHMCVGKALARLEMKIALETLLSRFDQVACPDDEDLPWTESIFTRGVYALPVVFD